MESTCLKIGLRRIIVILFHHHLSDAGSTCIARDELSLDLTESSPRFRHCVRAGWSQKQRKRHERTQLEIRGRVGNSDRDGETSSRIKIPRYSRIKPQRSAILPTSDEDWLFQIRRDD